MCLCTHEKHSIEKYRSNNYFNWILSLFTVYLEPQETNIAPTVPLCPGDTISFRCVSWQKIANRILRWSVTYPGKKIIRVTYDGNPFLHNTPHHLEMGITSTLTKLRGPNTPLKSVITLTVKHHTPPIYGTELSCTVGDRRPGQPFIIHGLKAKFTIHHSSVNGMIV